MCVGTQKIFMNKYVQGFSKPSSAEGEMEEIMWKGECVLPFFFQMLRVGLT